MQGSEGAGSEQSRVLHEPLSLLTEIPLEKTVPAESERESKPNVDHSHLGGVYRLPRHEHFHIVESTVALHPAVPKIADSLPHA